jgi:twinkle protein
MIDDWMSKPPRVSFSLAPCFADLEAATKGTGEGEVWIWTGGTGGGKSQIQDQNIVHWATSGIRVGFIKMEHTDSVNIQALLSVYLQANLKMDEVRSQFSPEELRKAYVDLFGSNMIYMIDHSHEDGSDSSLIDRIRQLAVGYKCKVIVIDHLNAVLYEDSDSEGDENRRTDRLLRTLAKLAAQYAVSIHIVAHPRKGTSGSKSAENGGSISLDDLKGSSGIKQIPDTVIYAQRDSQNPDPVIRVQAKLVLLKNRWMGETGDMDVVSFDNSKSTYTKIVEDNVY